MGRPLRNAEASLRSSALTLEGCKNQPCRCMRCHLIKKVRLQKEPREAAVKQ